MSRSAAPELKDCLESLKADGDRSLSARELADIVGEVARTLTADLGPLSAPNVPAAGAAPDAASGADLVAALAALEDIGGLLHETGRLADLQQELDQIRDATQDAATKYLATAEALEDMAGEHGLESDQQDRLLRLATDIYEASSFQDITGQRLTRVTDMLRQVEYYAASARAALGDSGAEADSAALSDTVQTTEQRNVEYILHGPQDAGTANTQEEIDKILASFD